MAAPDKDFYVAIELGSSKISAIAGRKKDGTMQVLAYAEEKTKACILRGVVYNIDKTYQCINTVLSKLESTLKTKISRVYVGLAGQSVRSYRCVIRRNMLTQSMITSDVIEEICNESKEIPFTDCEVLDNFVQEFVIDQNVVADPVGVMGTNIDGEYLDIIGKVSLREKVRTVFANTGVKIVEELISPLELANNVLTDAEKRSGCALVDLGADTTTLLIYKNNIVRYLVTLPLGMNNVNKDLATIQIDDAEAEEVKLKYADWEALKKMDGTEEPQTYTSSDGRKLDVTQIQTIIYARVREIVDNVNHHIEKSNYNDKLLAGVILTGGGSNMKSIDKAFLENSKIEKCRIARTITQPVVKTSNATGFVTDNAMSATLVSLLMAGTQPCGGEDFDRGDIFATAKQEEERQAQLAAQAAKQEAEMADAVAFDEVKASIREEYQKVQKMMEQLKNYGSDKQVRKSAQDLTNTALDVLGENYKKTSEALEGKDKFKQSLKEGSDLAAMLRKSVEQLVGAVNQANKENSLWGRVKRTLEEVVND